MTNAPPPDEFEAARRIVEILRALKPEEQPRVIRWVQESLGIPAIALTPVPTQGSPATPRSTGSDIATFIKTKSPSNDVQFAATVAYYYAFEAPVKRPEISADDLREATRLASTKRLDSPIQTLHNTVQRGYIDKGSTRGTFKINSVGENLVAMSLPTGTAVAATARPTRRPARKTARKK
jgi:hypothetical protein